MESTIDQGENILTDELDLVRQAQAGDRQSFIRLYRMNAGHVYAACLRMVVDRNSARDVAQDAIVRAWEMLVSFRGESPFSAWINRIAVNASLDHLRSRRRLSARVEFSPDLEIYETGDRSRPAESSYDLEDAIASLPAHARAVLVLHDIEGYTHEEIGSMMSIASGTSKAQLHRARQHLKEGLKR